MRFNATKRACYYNTLSNYEMFIANHDQSILDDRTKLFYSLRLWDVMKRVQNTNFGRLLIHQSLVIEYIV